MAEDTKDKSTSFDANREACLLILNSIAQYPQAMEGSYLIADKVLRKKKVRILDLAKIDSETDSFEWREKVNEIHKLFGVRRQVSSAEAGEFIRTFAHASIYTIRDVVVSLAMYKDITIPEFLKHGIRTRQEDFKMAETLQDFMDTNPEITSETSMVIHQKAEKVMETKSKHRLDVMARYNHSD